MAAILTGAFPSGALSLFLLLVLSACGGGPAGPGPDIEPGDGFTIDHTCTDIGQIPPAWIDSAQALLKVHYAHTSHGEQLTVGLERLESSDPYLDVEIGYCELPDAPGALCIFDGQSGETYITPDLYWQGEDGMDLTREVLDGNPDLNVSMWAWCTQCDYYSHAEVQEYLDAMTQFESEYPEVVFVYFTGNAQATGAEGWNRAQRNQQIRDYCEEHDRMLFDFEDLDSWWYDP
ncbi:hypothetical protein GX411_02720, partial [Candidatus Fermentibacteria bacterium]|nr:hypothetical protein [Candidatus Fermentibacteria bacterium]